MSGRIRSIKPEWLDDERLAECSSEARVLSIGLLLEADDHGNGRAWVTGLAGRVFPGKPREVLAKALEELRAIRYVLLYEVDGQHYFSIRNWSKHQKVDHPGRPKVPPPSAGSLEEKPLLAKPRETLSSPPETLAPDQEGKGTEGRGEEGEREGEPPAASPVKPTAPAKRAKARSAVDAESNWNDEQRARLVAIGRRCDVENKSFIAHHQAKGSLMASWTAARTTWVLGAEKGFGQPARQTPPGLIEHRSTSGRTGADGRIWTVTGWDSQKRPQVWTDEEGKTTYKDPFRRTA